MKERNVRCRYVVPWIFVAALVACGGGQPVPAAPRADTASAPTRQSDAMPGQPSVNGTPAEVNDTQRQAPPSPATAEPFPSQARMQQSRVDNINDALQRLERAGNDCTLACRALTSMDHACGELCAAATGSSERGLCLRSKERVRSARETVKRICGTCPGGTSVEPSDPIPSR